MFIYRSFVGISDEMHNVSSFFFPTITNNDGDGLSGVPVRFDPPFPYLILIEMCVSTFSRGNDFPLLRNYGNAKFLDQNNLDKVFKTSVHTIKA